MLESRAAMDLGLRNKSVLVTGASRGIGKAIAAAFAAEQARVAITAREEDELHQTALEIVKTTGAQVLDFAADLTQAYEAGEVVKKVVEEFSTIHVLVNNVGGVSEFAAFHELNDQGWLDAFNLNFMSAVRVTRATLPVLRMQKWGRIINISSESGTQPDAMMPHYNAAKAAMNNLTKSLSKAYAIDGVLVNTVSPAFILTPLLEEMLTKMASERGVSRKEVEAHFLAQNRPHIELKRSGRPEEVAAAVLFLASEQASFITGSNLRVDGGSVASI